MCIYINTGCKTSINYKLYILVFVLESESNHRKKDVDHRNLISLTGSPKEANTPNAWKIDGDQVIFHMYQQPCPSLPFLHLLLLKIL